LKDGGFPRRNHQSITQPDKGWPLNRKRNAVWFPQDKRNHRAPLDAPQLENWEYPAMSS
jgi:hypothetical protein